MRIKKSLPVIFLIMAIAIGCQRKESGTGEEGNLFLEVDKEIENASNYEREKENRIENIKKKLGVENSEEIRKELINWLISEYESYKSDSALYYTNLNLENESVKKNKKEETALLIRKADIAAHAGLFGEATEILENIQRTDIDSTLLESYYGAYCDLYQYQSEYAINSEYAARHEKLREAYIDSISRVASPSSINYVVNHAASEARNGNFKEAERMLLNSLGKYKSGERNFSILASILADIYKRNGDEKSYLDFISLSVISDVQGAIKENMAIRALATERYEAGDIERADRYLRQSFADANFFSARMRNAQSSRMLPIIGEAYTTHQKTLTHQLRLFIIFISILAFGFILIAIFAFSQVKKVRAINKKTKEMLEEVSKLSQQLKSVNEALSESNRELESANRTQREYGVLFMEYSSLAISALQKYQQNLRVIAAQGNIQSLLKKIESANMESKILEEFYSKFDEAVQKIYPGFLKKFNSLLKPEDRIELAENESFPTELRVFALIRIGVTDSEKIAQFLRCSLSTIYTYRSKMKRKALNPDTFEQSLLEN